MFDDRVLFTLQREKALGKLLGHMTSNSHGLLQLNRSLVNFTKTYDHTTREGRKGWREEGGGNGGRQAGTGRKRAGEGKI